MEKYVEKFDQVIIADNYQPRIDQIAHYLEETGRADNIDKIRVVRETPYDYLAFYNERIREALNEQKQLLVVHNYFVGLKNGYLKQLQQIEEETQMAAAKRIIISCISRDKIRGALNRMGAPLVEIVEYNKDLGISRQDMDFALGIHSTDLSKAPQSNEHLYMQAS